MSLRPPRPSLPPLNALRAFEAAAREGGFARAADVMNVTPGAIAQHVRVLEDWAGAPLFDRHARGVTPNALARRILPELQAGFDSLSKAALRLRREARPSVLHIAALPSVAQLWLSPRLPAIRAERPDLEISVTALEAPPDLSREPFDLALFFSRKPEGRVLVEDEITPVAAPALARNLHAPDGLHDIPLISDSAWPDDWALWARAAGLDTLVPQGGTHSLYALAVEEAVNGAGVLMGHLALLDRHLADGRLVAPFDAVVHTGQSLCAVLSPAAMEDPEARWLQDRL